MNPHLIFTRNFASSQTGFDFAQFCQTLECGVEEGCVLQAVVDGAEEFEGELTTTTGFTRVVVLRY